MTILLLCFHLPAFAQLGLSGAAAMVRGEVVDATNGEPLNAVTVTALGSQQSVYSEEDGRFSLHCAMGEKVTFTYVGYKSQELVATGEPLHVRLLRQSYSMKEVIVKPKYTQYQADSIERHSIYQRALARVHGGSVMSPVTALADALSKKSHQIYRFQKEFVRLENERYVDTKYTPELVAQMTKLDGDTLAQFMNAYPMPTEYAREASELEMKMWIRTNFRDWISKGRPLPKINGADSLLQKQPPVITTEDH